MCNASEGGNNSSNSANSSFLPNDSKTEQYCNCSKKLFYEFIDDLKSKNPECNEYLVQFSIATGLSFSSAIVIQIMN